MENLMINELNNNNNNHNNDNSIDNNNNNEKKINNKKMTHWEMLPSSSNWYCTLIADCNENQIFIYACKSFVSIFDVNKKKFIGELIGHNDRITSVSFFKRIDDNSDTIINGEDRNKLCITGSDDKTVRIWNYEDLKCLYFHQEHKASVTCVLSSPLVSDLVISGDKDGTLVIWKTKFNHVLPVIPITGNISITSLAFSPNNQDLITIGYSNGIVIIYNFILRTIICKISAHSSDVLSIVWFDSNIIYSNNIFNTNKLNLNSTDKNILPCGVYLSTCSKDKSIKIWKQVGNSIDIGFTSLYQFNPAKYSIQHSSGGSSMNEKQQRVWLTLSWSPASPQYLISNSLTADILVWDLSNLKQAPEKFQTGHQRLIFNIIQVPSPSTSVSVDPNDTSSSSTNKPNTAKYKNKIITLSLDRQIIIWENMKWKTRIQALGGFVYSIDTCSYTPNTFAIGCGDNTIRLWSPTENQKDRYESKMLWKGIQSKVTAISFCKDYGINHSTLIAFGMDDGRAGVYNINNNQSTIFPGGHKNEIYEIVWKPPNKNNTVENKQQEKPSKIYTIGNNEIFEWDYNHFDKGFTNMGPSIQSRNPNETFSKHRTDINWNLDGDMVAIGHSDGTIDIFNSDFKLLTRIKEHKKLINRVKWSQFPEHKNTLASASNDKKINIYKINQIKQNIEKDENQEENQKKEGIEEFKIELIYQFSGHRNNVCSIDWSKHDWRLLASASADGTIQVWNIESKELVSNMRGHDGRVFTVCWSFVEPNLLSTGGEDQTVRIWDYTKQPYKTPNESLPTKPSPPQIAISLNKKIEENKQQNLQETLVNTNTSSSTTSTAIAINNPVSPSKNQSSTSPVLLPENLPKKRPILLLNKDIVQKVDNTQSVIPLAKYILENEDKVNIDYGGNCGNDKIEAIFSEKKLVIDKLIEKESNELLKIDDIENYLSINCWNGNIKNALYQIIKNGKLTGNIVALSIQAGREIYESICSLYSQQLICTGDFHMAVSYLLLTGHVKDAIDVYRNAMLYQEAILLAKSRFPIDDPIIDQLFLEWAKLTETSHSIHSIKCYLAISKSQYETTKSEILKILSIPTKQTLKIQNDLINYLK
ncbi:hypothetical protein DICPUDRAFT_53135 [Dictyostelium purpureum]|uniref:Uncharacterized protein n=1 Tax=Dictyostelium purpureum TaxID=5786 RepID=F0ZBA8_DICPU|nr:uncharacterized protein DICPUDRAFT_53135 [Dictyostelium purpureum]EGC38787.1 hypothetical protein DICPUDRAFT_53135 [Dictyostelium purpureum]|eukprot:XP_003284681.1 hypothetical protein DICPUDRAFT_53135 [Dictyostelium purpureum]